MVDSAVWVRRQETSDGYRQLENRRHGGRDGGFCFLGIGLSKLQTTSELGSNARVAAEPCFFEGTERSQTRASWVVNSALCRF